MDTLERTFQDSLKMTAFSALRTGNPILDGILTASVIGLLTYLFRKSYLIQDFSNAYAILDDIKAQLCTRYSVKFQGKHNYAIYKYYGYTYLDLSFYSDIDLNAIKSNPLLKITENKIHFKYEENKNGT